MARKTPGRSRNTIRDPQRASGEAVADLDVDDAPAPGDTNIIVNGKTGEVRTENPDGSMTVGMAGKSRAPFKNTFAANLATDEQIEAILPGIAQTLLQQIQNDDQSRREWEETCKKGLDLMGVKLLEATADVSAEGTISQVKHSGLKKAVIKSWSDSRAELLPVGGPVKVRDDAETEDEELEADATAEGGIGHNGGPPLDDAAPAAPPPEMAGIVANAPGAVTAPLEPGKMGKTEKRNALANALERDFNHYLTVIDKDYYPDTSRMLMSRALLGCQFKKVYVDPILRRPVSRWVKGTNLIVSNEATSLTGAARVTEKIPMRQPTVKRLQKTGHWREIALAQPTTQPAGGMDKKIAESEGINPQPLLPEDYLHTIYECYCELDNGKLAKDEKGKEPGWPLPYRVTMDLDSQVILEIRRNWKEGDPDYMPRRRYVKFGMVPSLGFYDWGFVHLLGDLQRGATMILRNLIDTGMLASFPGGIMAKTSSTRQRTTQVRPGLGEFVVIDTGGLPVSDFVTTWPYKEPSATLAAAGQDLSAQMNQIAGVVELPVGEGRLGNTPVGTIMAYIESVSKVPSAVHKDDHIAQQEEFELLKELFAEDPASLIRGNKRPARKWLVAEEINDQDLVPAADPNVPSQTHRLMQAHMLSQLAGEQQFATIPNQRAIFELLLRTIGYSNTGEYILPPQPPSAAPPDPRIVAAQIRAQSEKEKTQGQIQIKTLDHSAKMEELAVTSADKAADRDGETERAAMKSHVEGAGIAANHAQHQDKMGVEGAKLAQEHVHHVNEMTVPPPTPPLPPGGIEANTDAGPAT